ncbi:MAG: DUF3768 domain-containing protein [Hyphomicrobiaceae bacterium]
MNIEIETSDNPDQVAARRAANDAFRSTLTGGCLTLTPGIIALGGANQARIVDAVRHRADFDDDDPLDAHDTGDIVVELEEPGIATWRELIFFRVEEFNPPAHSALPPSSTTNIRQLVIMLASEWFGIAVTGGRHE